MPEDVFSVELEEIHKPPNGLDGGGPGGGVRRGFIEIANDAVADGVDVAAGSVGTGDGPRAADHEVGFAADRLLDEVVADVVPAEGSDVIVTDRIGISQLESVGGQAVVDDERGNGAHGAFQRIGGGGGGASV